MWCPARVSSSTAVASALLCLVVGASGGCESIAGPALGRPSTMSSKGEDSEVALEWATNELALTWLYAIAESPEPGCALLLSGLSPHAAERADPGSPQPPTAHHDWDTLRQYAHTRGWIRSPELLPKDPVTLGVVAIAVWDILQRECPGARPRGGLGTRLAALHLPAVVPQAGDPGLDAYRAALRSPAAPRLCTRELSALNLVPPRTSGSLLQLAELALVIGRVHRWQHTGQAQRAWNGTRFAPNNTQRADDSYDLYSRVARERERRMVGGLAERLAPSGGTPMPCGDAGCASALDSARRSIPWLAHSDASRQERVLAFLLALLFGDPGDDIRDIPCLIDLGLERSLAELYHGMYEDGSINEEEFTELVCAELVAGNVYTLDECLQIIPLPPNGGNGGN